MKRTIGSFDSFSSDTNNVSNRVSSNYNLATILMDEQEAESSCGSVSSEKMIFFITIIETIIALSWILNMAFFSEAKYLESRCMLCFFYSHITIFLQVFDWCFFACCLYNLKSVIENPIIERTFHKRIKFFFIVSIIIASAFTFIVFMSGIYGVSPMLTCFIKNRFNEPSKSAAVYVVLSFPLVYIVFYIYIFFSLFKLRKLIILPEVKLVTVKLLLYSILYILFYFPTFFLYILTINNKIESPSFFSWFSYYCVLSMMSVNLVMGFGRALEIYGPCYLKDCFANNSKIDPDPAIAHMNSNGSNFFGKGRVSTYDLDNNHKTITFNYRGKSLLSQATDIFDTFLRDLMIGIIITLSKSSSEVKDIEGSLMNRYITEEQEYVFDSIEDPDGTFAYIDDNDLTAAIQKKPVHVEVIEHAPRIFKKIRKIDKLDEMTLIKSLLTANIKSISGDAGGKSGALFLPTSDNQYLIKTMEDSDFNSIMSNSFLNYYLMHLESNKDSMICRFYGIFTVKAEVNSPPFRLIVMRNAKGPFKRLIRLTYDLKGSTLNREVKIPDEFKGKPDEYFIVRKDINFNNDVGGMNLKDREKFMEIITKDALFFEDLGIMDYSLFVLQVKYTNKNFNKLITSDFFKYYSKYFFEGCSDESHDPVDSINEEEVEAKDVNSNGEGDVLSNEDKKKLSLNDSRDKEKVGYVIMVIDYLQKFTLNKQFEQGIKGVFNRGAIASSAPPGEYCKRFIKYCDQISGPK